MKKIIKFTTQLSLQIILLSIIGILGSYFSDYLSTTGFFNDTISEKADEFGSFTRWGARHMWYFWTVLVLFLIQIFRIMYWVGSYLSEEN